MFTVTMLFLVLQIVFVVPKVNHTLSGKSVLQILKLNSRTDQILAANAVDHFFWRKDLRNISDYNFDKPKKKKPVRPQCTGASTRRTFSSSGSSYAKGQGRIYILLCLM